jgi:hypothetical protein
MLSNILKSPILVKMVTDVVLALSIVHIQNIRFQGCVVVEKKIFLSPTRILKVCGEANLT